MVSQHSPVDLHRPAQRDGSVGVVQLEPADQASAATAPTKDGVAATIAPVAVSGDRGEGPPVTMVEAFRGTAGVLISEGDAGGDGLVQLQARVLRGEMQLHQFLAVVANQTPD